MHRGGAGLQFCAGIFVNPDLVAMVIGRFFAALPNRLTTRLQETEPSTKLMRATRVGGSFSSSARACGATKLKRPAKPTAG